MAEAERGPEDAPRDPRENRGLVAKLKELLIEKRKPEDVEAERTRAAEREARIEEDARVQAGKLQHLEEVSGEHGVVTADHRYDRPAQQASAEDKQDAA